MARKYKNLQWSDELQGLLNRLIMLEPDRPPEVEMIRRLIYRACGEPLPPPPRRGRRWRPEELKNKGEGS